MTDTVVGCVFIGLVVCVLAYGLVQRLEELCPQFDPIDHILVPILRVMQIGLLIAMVGMIASGPPLAAAVSIIGGTLIWGVLYLGNILKSEGRQ
jgi:hypothetical protein